MYTIVNSIFLLNLFKLLEEKTESRYKIDEKNLFFSIFLNMHYAVMFNWKKCSVDQFYLRVGTIFNFVYFSINLTLISIRCIVLIFLFVLVIWMWIIKILFCYFVFIFIATLLLSKFFKNNVNSLKNIYICSSLIHSICIMF